MTHRDWLNFLWQVWFLFFKKNKNKLKKKTEIFTQTSLFAPVLLIALLHLLRTRKLLLFYFEIFVILIFSNHTHTQFFQHDIERTWTRLDNAHSSIHMWFPRRSRMQQQPTIICHSRQRLPQSDRSHRRRSQTLHHIDTIRRHLPSRPVRACVSHYQRCYGGERSPRWLWPTIQRLCVRSREGTFARLSRAEPSDDVASTTSNRASHLPRVHAVVRLVASVCFVAHYRSITVLPRAFATQSQNSIDSQCVWFGSTRQKSSSTRNIVETTPTITLMYQTRIQQKQNVSLYIYIYTCILWIILKIVIVIIKCFKKTILILKWNRHKTFVHNCIAFNG